MIVCMGGQRVTWNSELAQEKKGSDGWSGQGISGPVAREDTMCPREQRGKRLITSLQLKSLRNDACAGGRRRRGGAFSAVSSLPHRVFPKGCVYKKR